ncbi:hypothetical protein D4R47_04090 [archaeon]|nr:MAG: hypothetical protein D4R47_04090 [archaeon]
MKNSLEYLFVEGSNFEMGYQIGEGRRDSLNRVIERYRRLFQHNMVDWDKLKAESLTYQAYTREALPQYWEEMEGMAQGAGVDIIDIFLLNSAQEVLEERKLGCTSLALNQLATADNSVLLAHNEDWLPSDTEEVYVLHAKPDNAPEYLCLTYVGFVHQGFNSAGIGSVGNAVSPRDIRPGIPRIFAYRDILSKTSLAEAMKAAIPRSRAAGNNHLVGNDSGEIYDLEVSATKYDTFYGEDGMLLHTNHYLSPKLQQVEEEGPYFDSILRYNRLRRLLTERMGRITVDDLKEILADHANSPNSICSHTEKIEEEKFQYSTIASVIIDLTHRTMYACKGAPCKGEFGEFRLGDGKA